MADEFHTTGNWWDSSRSRFESGTSSSSSSTQNTMGSFAAWLTEPVSASASTGSLGGESSGGGSLADPNLHMMNLGLSSQAMDWSQSLLRGDKGEGGFRSMLQENLNSNPSFQEESATGSSSQIQWRDQRIGDQASTNEFKPYSHGFDQMDSTMYTTPANILQGILGSSTDSHHHPHPHPHHQQQQHSSFDNRSLSSTSSTSTVNYPGFAVNYGLNTNELLPSWSSKAPQLLRISPPKQHPPHGHQLHFANNAPFWNAASAATVSDVRSSFFPSAQMHQFAAPAFEEKPKQNLGEAPSDPAGTVLKKSGNETTGKRARSETPTPLPAFKVRKEKMGDRITALQQLVAPFGKTDTASVLSEVIEYIKFLHQQVAALTTQYLKTGATFQHQQNPEKSKDSEGPKQDLRTRGLCLVPISSIYPVAHETPVDFWAPSFGGTFR